jgi:hypothetical protein
MEEKKKTYGQIILDHSSKNYTLDDDIKEYYKELESDILKKIEELVEKNIRDPLYKNKNFYVVILTKIERIGKAVRNLIFSRFSCPTPIYSQVVWKYDCKKEKLEFLWCIPDKYFYHHILKNKEEYIQMKEARDLVKFVVSLENGSLLEWVKEENGNKKDAVIKNNKEEQCQMN